MKEFDEAELAKYSGENGSPIYVAQGGKVYDVTESKLWRNGKGTQTGMAPALRTEIS